jgi:hypothetical protein
MKGRVDDVIAKRSAAKNGTQRHRAEGRAPLSAPHATGRKGSSTPSFRALGIRAVIAFFVVLAVMYGLNAFLPMAVNFIAGGR